MSTVTPTVIREWLQRGVQQGATHVLVVCDTFSHEDFPVFVLPDQNVYEQFDAYRNPERMLSVTEVYCLAADLDAQLALPRTAIFTPRDLVRAQIKREFVEAFQRAENAKKHAQ